MDFSMTSITLKRLFVAVASLFAVSAAFAIGYVTDFQAMERAPRAIDMADAWLASALSGDAGSAWNVAAAIGIMAVIAKRSGKA
jgi:hypothetical protein